MQDVATNLLRQATTRAIEEQVRWEIEATNRGVRRYRETCAGLTLDATPPGLSVMRDAMPGVVAEIRAAQAEAEEGIVEGGSGRQPEWWWPIAMLDVEVLATITMRAILMSPHRAALEHSVGGRPMTATATLVATMLRNQIDYQRWVETEQQEQKAAKRAGIERRDLLAALKSRTKKVDARAWRRWNQRLKRVSSEVWPLAVSVLIGSKLIDCAVRGSGGWFEVVCTRLKREGKTQYRVVLSEVARRAIEDLHQRAEVAAPLRLPMICPPNPWKYEEPTDGPQEHQHVRPKADRSRGPRAAA